MQPGRESFASRARRHRALPRCLRRSAPKTCAAALFCCAAISLLAAPVRAQTDVPAGKVGPSAPDLLSALSGVPEANLFSGAATTSIPIALPPGRNGMTPALALTYSSGGGPGLYGYGWDLPIGRIQRRQNFGLLTCATASERNEFVLMLPGHKQVEFHLDETQNPPRGYARIEKSFFHIEAIGNVFRVWDAGGTMYEFGEISGNSWDRFRDTSCTAPENYLIEDEYYTFAWNLTRVTDPNGNLIEIEYEENGNTIEQRSPRPRWIRYGGNTAGIDHPFTVEFRWEGRPPGDEILNARGGFTARLTERLSRLDVAYNGAPVRSYEFRYQDGERRGRQSFLTSVRLLDKNGQYLRRADSAPAEATFQYAEPPSADFGFSTAYYGGPALPITQRKWGRWRKLGSAPRTLRDLMDINGDGFLDVVDSQPLNQGSLGNCTSGVPGEWEVYLGSAAGFAPTPTPWQVPDQRVMCFIREQRVADNRVFTDRATIDFNGDGVADYIDASQADWRIYLGMVGSKPRFNAPPIILPGIGASLGRARSGVDLLGHTGGTEVTKQLIDVNGDGRIDMVDAGEDADSLWRVWINTGYGLAAPRTFRIPFGTQVISYQTADGLVLTTRDMNGDALPDQVVATGEVVRQGPAGEQWDVWNVYLNSGKRIDANPQEWLLPIMGPDPWLQTVDKRDVYRSITDINGDGLPDVIDTAGWANNNLTWQVVLNRGGGFSDRVELWHSPFNAISYSARDSSDTATTHDTVDVDGDGLLDYIRFDSDTFTVRYNLAGATCAIDSAGACLLSGHSSEVGANPAGIRTNLLERIQNPTGGVSTIRYRPSTSWPDTRLSFPLWTVTRIEADDGLCVDGLPCEAVGTHSLLRRLEYEKGVFDPLDHEFRGFRTVRVADGEDDAGKYRLTETNFHQDEVRVGQVSSRSEYAVSAGALALRTRLTMNWGCADPVTGSSVSCSSPPERAWLRLTDVVTEEHGPGGPRKRVYAKNRAWQKCAGEFTGNVTARRVRQEDAPQLVHSYTEYACNDPLTAAHITNRPSHMWTTDTNDNQDAPLQEQWFWYDERGNRTAAEAVLDKPGVTAVQPCSAPGGSGKLCIRTEAAYDQYGSVTSSTDANGRSTRVEYDADHLYPAFLYSPAVRRSALTAPAEHVVASAYDPGCATLLWQTVPYTEDAPINLSGSQPSAAARFSYDSFCRLKRVYAPGQTGYQQNFSYVVKPRGSPSYIIRTTPGLDGDPAHNVRQFAFVDGLGRHVQEKREAIMFGQPATVSTQTSFDARGNIAARYAPFETPDLPFGGHPPAQGHTSFAHDAMGRVTRITNPDGTFRTIDRTVPGQTTVHDECYSASSSICPGGAVVERRNAPGRVIEKELYEQDTLKARTRYTYDELGRLLVTEQGDANEWKTTTQIQIDYDSLGRKVFMHDPDSGDWFYGYDAVGNLLYQDDPKPGQQVQYCYDALDRPIIRVALSTDFAGQLVACPEAGDGHLNLAGLPAGTTILAEVRFHYDDPEVPNGLGKLTSVDDRSGQTRFEEYDLRGRLRRTTKKIALPAIDAPGTNPTATFSYDYYDTGPLRSIRYPDGEVTRYAYDPSGQLVSVIGRNGSSETSYLDNAKYDLFGRPQELHHGNGTTDFRTYDGADKNYRLTSLRTVRDGSAGPSATYLDLQYDSYTFNGMVAAVRDNRDHTTAMSNDADYWYDGLGRLARSSAAWELGYRTYQYNALGNLRQKGNLQFAYPTTQTPHQPTSAWADSALSLIMQYDENGNRTLKANQENTDAYHYTPHDELERITHGTDTVDFVYDYTGRRVAKVVNDGESVTRYYSELIEETDGVVIKHYVGAGLLLASRRVDGSLALMNTATGGAAPLVRLARVPAGHVALVLTLRRDAGLAVALAISVLALGMVFAPWRRKRVVGLAVRHGHVIGVMLTFVATSLPVPIIVRPAEAGCGGSGPPPYTPTPANTQAPTRTTTPTPVPAPPEVFYYHYDHLGSVQAVTDRHGDIVQHIRYDAWGRIRGRFDAAGNPIDPPDPRFPREFAGYETEMISGLQYAGARFYDPEIGMFLTHDPLREFPNPYAYAAWNPINFVDSGGLFPDDPTWGTGAAGPPPPPGFLDWGGVPCSGVASLLGCRDTPYPTGTPPGTGAAGPPPVGAAGGGGPTRTSGSLTDSFTVEVSNSGGWMGGLIPPEGCKDGICFQLSGSGGGGRESHLDPALALTIFFGGGTVLAVAATLFPPTLPLALPLLNGAAGALAADLGGGSFWAITAGFAGSLMAGAIGGRVAQYMGLGGFHFIRQAIAGAFAGAVGGFVRERRRGSGSFDSAMGVVKMSLLGAVSGSLGAGWGRQLGVNTGSKLLVSAGTSLGPMMEDMAFGWALREREDPGFLKYSTTHP